MKEQLRIDAADTLYLQYPASVTDKRSRLLPR